MSRYLRTKVSAAALVAAVVVTFAAAVAHASPGHGTASAPAKLLPDPCAWDAAPAPPTPELTAVRPITPSSEKGFACPIERNA